MCMGNYKKKERIKILAKVLDNSRKCHQIFLHLASQNMVVMGNHHVTPLNVCLFPAEISALKQRQTRLCTKCHNILPFGSGNPPNRKFANGLNQLVLSMNVQNPYYSTVLLQIIAFQVGEIF